jgi:hypothetical protein
LERQRLDFLMMEVGLATGEGGITSDFRMPTEDFYLRNEFDLAMDLMSDIWCVSLKYLSLNVF